MKKNIDENEIFKAAVAEFSTKSFDEASLNTIIKNAHISKGSFYYRFKTKYDLYIHVLKTCLKQKWDFIRKQADADPVGKSTNRSPVDIFNSFAIQAKLSIDFAHKFPLYHALSMMFAKEKGTKLFDDAVKDLGADDQLQIKQLIVTAFDNKEFDKQFSKDFIEKIITHLFLSFYEVFSNNEESDIETLHRHLKEYIEFMRKGLASG